MSPTTTPTGASVLDGPNEIEWSTRSFVDNPDGNALRWGTLYNFRFDADVPPAFHDVSIGLFRPGVPDRLVRHDLDPRHVQRQRDVRSWRNLCQLRDRLRERRLRSRRGLLQLRAGLWWTRSPELSCGDQADNDCDQYYDCFDTDCCADVGCAPPDADGDHFVGCGDCVEGDETIWGTPSDVLDVRVAKVGIGGPADLGRARRPRRLESPSTSWSARRTRRTSGIPRSA